MFEPILEDVCPKCGSNIYSEGIDNGIGYVYPPLHCECGWSEMCSYQDEEGCKQCDQYEYCYCRE